MELICYLEPGWAPLVRPAPATRAWMDATPEAFAYRCLPLDIANAHGWEILCPIGFEAAWNGAAGTEGIQVMPDAGAPTHRIPVSLFGQGVLTFHIEGLIRTPPGWNLWVGGSPNRFKDGIQPLTGIIETDWSPFTFTMNWRFTRAHQRVRFEPGEPMCFFFPVERAAIERFRPRFAPLGEYPQTQARFHAWNAARSEFHQRVAREMPAAPADRWQKHYYRGIDIEGRSHIHDHRAKLRLQHFDRAATPSVPVPPPDDAGCPEPRPVADPRQEIAALRAALQRRDGMLEIQERQRDLAPITAVLERHVGLGTQEFLERYYAAGRPVILEGEMPGSAARFAASTANPADTFAIGETLAADGETLGKFLAADFSPAHIQTAQRGSTTRLQNFMANSFLCQVRGRCAMKIVPASEMGRLESLRQAFGDHVNLSTLGAALENLRFYDIVLGAGDILYLPLFWFCQAHPLDDSICFVLQNFRWMNPGVGNEAHSLPAST